MSRRKFSFFSRSQSVTGVIGIFKWALPRSTRMFKWRTAEPSAMRVRSSKLMKLKFAESFLSTEIGEMSIDLAPRILLLVIAINESRRLYSFMSRNERNHWLLEGEKRGLDAMHRHLGENRLLWIEVERVGRRGNVKQKLVVAEIDFHRQAGITQRNS